MWLARWSRAFQQVRDMLNASKDPLWWRQPRSLLQTWVFCSTLEVMGHVWREGCRSFAARRFYLHVQKSHWSSPGRGQLTSSSRAPFPPALKSHAVWFDQTACQHAFFISFFWLFLFLFLLVKERFIEMKTWWWRERWRWRKTPGCFYSILFYFFSYIALWEVLKGKRKKKKDLRSDTFELRPKASHQNGTLSL